MADELLTIEEAKKYLRIHKATLYKLAKAKKVPACKIGKKWRFRKDKLDDWLDKQAEVR